ncbi:apolipoprotein N-acyltransferase [Candidatus Margulisiibacteriota bacterium]
MGSKNILIKMGSLLDIIHTVKLLIQSIFCFMRSFTKRISKQVPILTISSALLTSLIFPNFNQSWLAYFCLVPALFELHYLKSTYKTVFARGVLFGVILVSLFHIWMLELHIWASWPHIILIWIAASVFYGFFYGISFLLGSLVKSDLPLIFCFPSAWIIGEWLRSIGPLGNTAASIGYSQTSFLPVLQWASYGGVYFLSFFCVLINVLFFLMIKNLARPSVFLKYTGIIIILFSIVIIIGKNQYKINNAFANSQSSVKIAVIQANHAQKDKLDKNKWPSIRRDYLALCASAAQKNPQFIICPETITPTFNLRRFLFISTLMKTARKNNINIILGTPIEEQEKFYNSVVAVTPRGLAKEKYRKVRLMPFGEYWPFKTFLKLLGLEKWVSLEDYSPGKSVKPLQIGNYFWGIGICLESIYPNYFRKYIKAKAQFFAVLVNNAWFFRSSAAAEHLQMSIMRAVENNRYLVQAANTGISAIVSNTGEIVKKTELEENKILYGTIYYGLPNTFYAKSGDWIIFIGIALLFFFNIYGVARKY